MLPKAREEQVRPGHARLMMTKRGMFEHKDEGDDKAVEEKWMWRSYWTEQRLNQLKVSGASSTHPLRQTTGRKQMWAGLQTTTCHKSWTCHQKLQFMNLLILKFNKVDCRKLTRHGMHQFVPQRNADPDLILRLFFQSTGSNVNNRGADRGYFLAETIYWSGQWEGGDGNWEAGSGKWGYGGVEMRSWLFIQLIW